METFSATRKSFCLLLHTGYLKILQHKNFILFPIFLKYKNPEEEITVFVKCLNGLTNNFVKRFKQFIQVDQLFSFSYSLPSCQVVESVKAITSIIYVKQNI